MPITNIGSGSPKEVSDRKLPTALDPECMRSAMKGIKGIGLNEYSMNQSMKQCLNQGPQLDGDTDKDGEFDGK